MLDALPALAALGCQVGDQPLYAVLCCAVLCCAVLCCAVLEPVGFVYGGLPALLSLETKAAHAPHSRHKPKPTTKRNLSPTMTGRGAGQRRR